LICFAAWAVVHAGIRGAYQRIGAVLTVLVDVFAVPMFTEVRTMPRVYMPLSGSIWIRVVEVVGLMPRTVDGPN